MAGDHADVPFVQAKKFGTGRPDGPPLWIVWHTMEEDELLDTAERVARYFATLPDGRSVSSHYCVDGNSIVQCVLLRHRAWTVGNTPGNNRGINVELAGRAAQTAAQWADPYSRSMLGIACGIVARDMDEYEIPNRWCTVADLLARRPGHTTHNDLRLAFGGTTHTDPGAAFPRDLVLALVAGGGEDDMDQTDELFYKTPHNPTRKVGHVLTDVSNLRDALIDETDAVPGDPAYPKAGSILGRLLTAAEAPTEPAQVDVDELVEALKPHLEAAAEAAVRKVLGGLDGAVPPPPPTG